ncbi:hypothetical protein OGAPHI_003729 [Ogataea philodendri]|uniref:Sorting nexin MVP1 n=1 Tax=Ogataea philodendri TaxID=1378263 RepID=A0A9P8P4A1_9ASCO|nr:uncharacterized protein OGAPHI_003729 [Ogataea philodendri]KAH3665543.1 hypothetical protein OGAPHI_003729 [Ogataea philodendri]
MSDSIFGAPDSLMEEDPWALPTTRNSQTLQSSILEDNNWSSYNSNDILTNNFASMGIDKPHTTAEEHETQPIAPITDPLVNQDDQTGEDPQEEDLKEESVWSEELVASFNPLGYHNTDDKTIIRVKEIPEKEGLVFKHINYLISHNLKFPSEYYQADNKATGSETRIIRRYSDFAWLIEVLWQKYPYRLIPELPPKKLYSIFLQKRRRSLQRFLYQLSKHPILSKESLVIMFFTVPNDFSNWKKFANIELTDEYENIRITLPKRFKINLDQVLKGLHENDPENDEEVDRSVNNDSIINNITQIWNESPVDHKKLDFIENLQTINASLTKFADIWAKLCILVERIEKRELALSMDHQRFSLYLGQFVNNSGNLYGVENLVGSEEQPEDSQNLSIINTILKQVIKYFTNTKQLKDDELSTLSSDTLENFRKLQDYLASLHFLIERLGSFKSTSEKQIHTLLNRITKTNERLFQIKIKSDIRGSEVDKLVTVLTDSSDSLSSLLSRIILVKSAFLNEFKLFQKTKYLVSETFQDWFVERVKYGELQQDALQRVFNDLQDMPLK